MFAKFNENTEQIINKSIWALLPIVVEYMTLVIVTLLNTIRTGVVLDTGFSTAW